MDAAVYPGSTVVMDATQEPILIQRSQKGDTRAFNELYRLYEKRIYNFALRMSGNQDDAEDICQETFIRVYNAIGSFRGDAHFSTWVFRIAHNVFLDMRKKSRAHPVSSLDDALELEESDVHRQVEDPNPQPQEVALSSELTKLLQEAIDELPDYQKMMVVMYHTQNLSYEQIADVLQLPIGTVKSRLNRARLALKGRLDSIRKLYNM